MKIVEYASDHFGYQVEVSENGLLIEEYFAGNSPFDSQASYDPDGIMPVLPLRTICQYAKQTAQEFAKQYGIETVFENPDIRANEDDFL